MKKMKSLDIILRAYSQWRNIHSSKFTVSLKEKQKTFLPFLALCYRSSNLGNQEDRSFLFLHTFQSRAVVSTQEDQDASVSYFPSIML